MENEETKTAQRYTGFIDKYFADKKWGWISARQWRDVLFYAV